MYNVYIIVLCLVTIYIHVVCGISILGWGGVVYVNSKSAIKYLGYFAVHADLNCKGEHVTLFYLYQFLLICFWYSMLLEHVFGIDKQLEAFLLAANVR